MFTPKIFDIIIPDTSQEEIDEFFLNQEKLKNKQRKLLTLKKGILSHNLRDRAFSPNIQNQKISKNMNNTRSNSIKNIS